MINLLIVSLVSCVLKAEHAKILRIWSCSVVLSTGLGWYVDRDPQEPFQSDFHQEFFFVGFRIKRYHSPVTKSRSTILMTVRCGLEGDLTKTIQFTSATKFLHGEVWKASWTDLNDPVAIKYRFWKVYRASRIPTRWNTFLNSFSGEYGRVTPCKY